MAKNIAKPPGNPDMDSGKREKVRLIPVDLIDPFPNHPFQVRDDAEMDALVESIREYGVITPCIIRGKVVDSSHGHCPFDRYEMIAGRRRLFACKRLEKPVIPAILRDMTYDEAVILLVDSNLQREHILPSERAFAYKMKLEALKRQGRRTDLTSTPGAGKLETADLIGRECGMSGDQVRRYIRLTHLISELLEDVDLGMIALKQAVELSYLNEEEQKDLSYLIDELEATPSLAQAIQIRAISAAGTWTLDEITRILSTAKPNQIERIKIPAERLKKYFARGTSQSEIESVIIAALEEYYQRRRKTHK